MQGSNRWGGWCGSRLHAAWSSQNSGFVRSGEHGGRLCLPAVPCKPRATPCLSTRSIHRQRSGSQVTQGVVPKLLRKTAGGELRRSRLRCRREGTGVEVAMRRRTPPFPAQSSGKGSGATSVRHATSAAMGRCSRSNTRRKPSFSRAGGFGRPARRRSGGGFTFPCQASTIGPGFLCPNVPFQRDAIADNVANAAGTPKIVRTKALNRRLPPAACTESIRSLSGRKPSTCWIFLRVGLSSRAFSATVFCLPRRSRQTAVSWWG